MLEFEMNNIDNVNENEETNFAAIKVIGEILWGYEDRESVGILKQFATKNYGED